MSLMRRFSSPVHEIRAHDVTGGPLQPYASRSSLVADHQQVSSSCTRRPGVCALWVGPCTHVGCVYERSTCAYARVRARSLSTLFSSPLQQISCIHSPTPLYRVKHLRVSAGASEVPTILLVSMLIDGSFIRPSIVLH